MKNYSGLKRDSFKFSKSNAVNIHYHFPFEKVVFHKNWHLSIHLLIDGCVQKCGSNKLYSDWFLVGIAFQISRYPIFDTELQLLPEKHLTLKLNKI